MTRLLLLLLLVLLLFPGLAAAQAPRSGPSAPATNALVPPSSPGTEQGNAPSAAPGDPNARTGASDARTAPPPDHRVLGGPAVPGARQPGHSEGLGNSPGPDPIPPDIGERVRPNASTTGR
jgi:hypothetical protein